MKFITRRITQLKSRRYIFVIAALILKHSSRENKHYAEVKVISDAFTHKKKI